MSKTRTFDESEALELYHEHKTDVEIAAAVGSKKGTITSWRNRSNLPNISTDYHNKVAYPDERAGVSYRSVLNEEQAEKMHCFLCALSWAHSEAKKRGLEKPRIMWFMDEWRGKPHDVSEKAKERREKNKEYKRAKKAVQL